MTELPDVRKGQVWADNDPRSDGRLLLVLDTPTICRRCHPAGEGRKKVTVEVVRSRDVATGPSDARSRGRRQKIMLRRFRPTSTGYRLTDLTSEDVS